VRIFRILRNRERKEAKEWWLAREEGGGEESTENTKNMEESGR